MMDGIFWRGVSTDQVDSERRERMRERRNTFKTPKKRKEKRSQEFLSQRDTKEMESSRKTKTKTKEQERKGKRNQPIET